MICLLTIITPKTIEDVIVDWLLEQEGFTGFNQVAINGYGMDEEKMSLSEKVTGNTDRIMFQMHMPSPTADIILSNLKKDFGGSDIHYMISPVTEAGNLAFHKND